MEMTAALVLFAILSVLAIVLVVRNAARAGAYRPTVQHFAPLVPRDRQSMPIRPVEINVDPPAPLPYNEY